MIYLNEMLYLILSSPPNIQKKPNTNTHKQILSYTSVENHQKLHFLPKTPTKPQIKKNGAFVGYKTPK